MSKLWYKLLVKVDFYWLCHLRSWATRDWVSQMRFCVNTRRNFAMSLAPVSKKLFQKTSACFKAKLRADGFDMAFSQPCCTKQNPGSNSSEDSRACKRKPLWVYSQNLLVTQGRESWSMWNTESIFSQPPLKQMKSISRLTPVHLFPEGSSYVRVTLKPVKGSALRSSFQKWLLEDRKQ